MGVFEDGKGMFEGMRRFWGVERTFLDRLRCSGAQKIAEMSDYWCVPSRPKRIIGDLNSLSR
jgi:hypothetical protein